MGGVDECFEIVLEWKFDEFLVGGGVGFYVRYVYLYKIKNDDVFLIVKY